MAESNQLEAFIELARRDPQVQRKLADCAIEDWADGHIPLDIDIAKVIAVANESGLLLTLADIVEAQCSKLSEFWQFEMGNAFSARRAMSIIQLQVSGERPGIYGYYQ